MGPSAMRGDIHAKHEALKFYCDGLVAALEWYALDDRYRGHDPEVLSDCGYVARQALDGDSS